jgi:hypothetical protein
VSVELAYREAIVAMPVMTELSKIEKALGSKSKYFLEHVSKGIPKETLQIGRAHV